MIEVLGYTYRIEKKPAHEIDGNWGRTSTVEQVVQIADHLTGDQLPSTLLHEVIHAVSDNLGIELNEHQIRLLEAGLYSVFKVNGVDLTPLMRFDA